ncbi:MBL fold metallo-hydrolase [Frigidibacter sp. RF13]|uniref:MBL fold metallo-hydrolase n=1 Tax=Frigidibacter sp. RF13 TaxID=2997340 RepID=UPI00226F90D0|nr:MBL fold metallo-hydrolase [Frigidibacter sp. RF13]MCY1127585.1 MBL fold metallo-hydrolase [Frigidibacter sp. RF13]
MKDLTRRQSITLSLAAPAIALAAAPVSAKAPIQGPSAALYQRFMLGDLEVTALLSNNRTVEKPHEIFGLNASDEDFAAVSAQAFLPTDKAQFFFTPTLVNTGSELVLFDTSTDPGSITAALAAAGYAPDQIDKVVLTHMHPDHIGGLMTEGKPTFANATYVTGATEHNFWSANPSDQFTANVVPLNDRIAFLDDGGTAAPGIVAMEAFGHTPGHMAFVLDSGGKVMAITGDTANHYVWSLAYPDWEVKFDADKANAAASRRRVFGKIAADRIPFIGYHMPFPSIGYVEAQGDGFRYVPASYQLML